MLCLGKLALPLRSGDGNFLPRMHHGGEWRGGISQQGVVWVAPQRSWRLLLTLVSSQAHAQRTGATNGIPKRTFQIHTSGGFCSSQKCFKNWFLEILESIRSPWRHHRTGSERIKIGWKFKNYTRRRGRLKNFQN